VVFRNFVEACRSVGIDVPILPGIMPITKMAGFSKMTAFCKSRVPTELRELLNSVQEDPIAVEQTGIQVMTAVCDALMKEGFPLHFYTLNTAEATFKILKNLDLLKGKEVEGALAKV